jgi:hypothetical protein
MSQVLSTKSPPPRLELASNNAALHAQLLATEHWSLLGTRSMTWNEIFSRTGTFLTVLSASVVALSLVAQATGFGRGYQVFGLLVLPIVLLIGLGTFIRLIEADCEDIWLVIGMNRIRHAYLQLALEIEPYFVTGLHDDELGVLQTYSFRSQVGPSHLLAGTPVIVGTIDAVIAGVLTAIAGQALGGAVSLQIGLGLLVAVASGGVLGTMGYRRIAQLRRDFVPQFQR